jgi:hypothetical protein
MASARVQTGLTPMDRQPFSKRGIGPCRDGNDAEKDERPDTRPGESDEIRPPCHRAGGEIENDETESAEVVLEVGAKDPQEDEVANEVNPSTV